MEMWLGGCSGATAVEASREPRAQPTGLPAAGRGPGWESGCWASNWAVRSWGKPITSLRDVTTSAVLLTSELMRKTLLRCPLAFWTPGPTMHTVGWQVRPQGVWLGRGQG